MPSRRRSKPNGFITDPPWTPPSDDRTQRILQLREKGWTYQAIGDEFGISRERVYQIAEATDALAQ